MTYPKRLLTEGEDVVRAFRPHWRLLVIPLFWVVLSIAAVVATLVFDAPTPVQLVAAGLAVIVSVWWGLRPFINWWFTHYVLTNERLIKRSGAIARRGVEIPLENINDVRFSQNIIERLLRSGDLLIESAGEQGQSRFRDIPEPEEFQSLVYRIREQRSVGLSSAGQQDPTAQLETLSRLHRDGVITDEEFQEKKQKLLDQM
jgi:uncharacterized membrane protein YdbT with pleckstrin-like domain